MKRLLVLTILLSVTLAGQGRAEIPIGANAPELEAQEWINSDAPVRLSELRGMVVVLFFWVTFHAGGQNTMQLMNVVESNPGLGRARGVFVVGLTDSDRKRTEQQLEKEKVSFPVGVGSKAHEEYQIQSFPHVVVLDTAGKVAWTGWPGKEDDMVKAVLDVLAKTPPKKTHPAEAAKAREHLKLAKESIRAAEYRKAFVNAREAFEHALRGDPLKALCQDMLDLIEAVGKDRLANADILMQDRKWEDAVGALRQVVRQFNGLDVSKSALERLESYRKQFKEVAAVLKAQEATDKARVQLGDAVDAIQQRNFGEGYALLETIIKDNPGTDVADDAQTVLARMKKNDKVLSLVRNDLAAKECETWLSQARTYLRANRMEQGKDLLRKVIDKYPETRFADEAARELARLP